jgi:hypothetical protein
VLLSTVLQWRPVPERTHHLREQRSVAFDGAIPWG